MPSLKAGNGQFILARLAGAIAACNSGGAIGTATRNFGERHLPLLRIGDAHNDHTMMQQRGMKAGQGGFLPAMLSRRTGEHAAHLADESAFSPESPRLIEKITHLRAHIAEAGGCA